MLSANMTNHTDYTAVDASFKYFQHNSSKHTYKTQKFYKKLSEKQVTLESHQKFLNTCLRSEIIPKFIRNQTKSIDNKLCNYKQQIQQRILENTVKTVTKQQQKLKTQIQIMNVKLVASFTNSWNLKNFEQWTKNLKTYLQILKQKREFIHRNKLHKLGINISKQNKLIYNLSSQNLSPNIIELLEKGPKFVIDCRTPLLYEKVELEYLCHEIGHDKPETKILANSLKHLFWNYEKRIKSLNTLFKNQREEIQSILKEQNIVCVKSDKGNSLVIMDKQQYIKTGEDFLNNIQFTTQNTDNNKNKYTKLCSFLLNLKKKDEMDDKVYKLVYPKTFRTPAAYFLPKTHKKDYEKNLKFRPIISSFDSYNFKLAKYLAFEISKVANMSNSSTDDFLKNFRKIEFIKTNFMASLDIENMYPSIPLDIIIQKAADLLYERHENKLSKESIKTLLEFCTKEITFSFADKLYQQNSGLAMGSPLAPILANLYFRDFETLRILSQNFPFKFKFYYRYMDDLFFVFNENYNQEDITNYFNQQDQYLKFTIETESEDSLQFLDMQVVRKLGVLETRWYRKLSNTLTFSSWDSLESKLYKIRLIYTMVNRLSKICSTTQFYDDDLKSLYTSFLDSGYPQEILSKHFKKAVHCLKKSLCAFRSKTVTEQLTTKRCYYMGFYYKSFQTELFSQRVKKLVRRFYPDIKLTTFYKHGPNIISLFSSKIKTQTKQTETGVYKILCKNCEKSYIGETGRSLLLRMNEHEKFHDIRKSAIANHRFGLNHQMDFQNARVVHKENNLVKRKIAEALLIKKSHVIPENSQSFSPIIFN